MEERLRELENTDADEMLGYVQQDEPFVVRGLCRDWPALAKWSFAYLTPKLKNTPGKVYKATFRTRAGELRDDIPVKPAIERVIHHERNFEIADNMALWLSPATNVTALHYDGYAFDGLNVQVTGSKTFELFHPDLECKMAPFVQGVVPRDGDAAAQRRVASYRVRLEPGDCLFTPRFWYHAVTAHSDATNVQYHFARRAPPAVQTRARRNYANDCWILAHAPWLIPSGVRRGIAEYAEIVALYAAQAHGRQALAQAAGALGTMAELALTAPRRTLRFIRYFDRKTVEELSQLL